MSWWIWVILFFVVLGFIGNKRPEGVTKSNARSKPKISAEEAAHDITTVAQYRALERKLNTLEERLAEHSGSDKSYDTLSNKYTLIEDTLRITSKKTLGWQFIPFPEITTALFILQNGYKVFSVDEYEAKFIELGKNKGEWFKLQGGDEPDEKDPDLNFPIKFRKIVENKELEIEAMSKKINSLVTRNKKDARDYFDLEDDMSPAEQWFTEISEETVL